MVLPVPLPVSLPVAERVFELDTLPQVVWWIEGRTTTQETRVQIITQPWKLTRGWWNW